MYGNKKGIQQKMCIPFIQKRSMPVSILMRL
jgi:hypothetical protein